MNVKSKSGLLVFLEFIDEAEVFIKEYENELYSAPENITIISFHPLVKSYLIKQQIKATDSFQFCPTESHRKLLCILEDATSDIRGQCSITDENGVRHAYAENLIFSLRPIISHILYRIEVITNALRIYRPNAVVSVGSIQPFSARSTCIESNERYIASIVRQVCAAHDIPQHNIEISMSPDKRRIPIWQWSQHLFVNFLNSFKERSDNLVVAPGIDYGMGEVISDLAVEKNRDFKVASMQLPKKSALLSMLGKYAKQNSDSFEYIPCNIHGPVRVNRIFKEQKIKFHESIIKIMDDWKYYDVLFGGWLRNKYIYGLDHKVIDETYYCSININKYLDRFQPSFVLAQHSRMSTAVLGELCQLKKIPSMMIPHGTFVPITDEYSKKEWSENALGLINTPYQYVALQTPMAQGFISEVPVKSQPVITGPLLFGRGNRPSCDTSVLRRRYASDSEKILLHAGTAINRSATRLLNYVTLDEYVDGIVSLVKIVAQLEDVRLIIRFRPIDGLTQEDLKMLLPACGSYSIASDGDFASYLSVADLLVSFSSTTIEEALQNNIPVLLYNKYNRYQHILGMELTPASPQNRISAVYNINNGDDLLFGLQWILENHLSKVNNVENLFSQYQYYKSDRNELSTVIKLAVQNGSNSSATISALDRMISQPS